MLRKIAFLMVLLMGTVSVVSGQTTIKMNARALLTELDSMLIQIPETKEECQALLKEIKDWYKEKLKELKKQERPLRITAPADGAEVPWRPFVEGTVAGPNAKVWAIVHPMSGSTYYVQPSLSVKEGGTWRVKIYIGRKNRDVGERFEIMAVANPKRKLKEADELPGWPEAQWTSQMIEVIRK